MKITIQPSTKGEKQPKALMEGRWSLGLNYQIVREIGHGSYGRVYEAIDNKAHERVAIKKFVRALGHPLLAQYCLRELEIMSKLSHANIVRVHRILHSSQSVYIVMDYMPFDLKKLIYSETFLDHEQVKTLMYEIMIAINYMHSSKIVHRDIKPGNILVTPECTAKLCDFGLARSICGLKITKFDFDEIYRREFAESNDQSKMITDIPAPMTAPTPNPVEPEEKSEDLDEHVMVNTNLAMPGYFDVNFKQEKKDGGSGVLKTRLKGKLIADKGILRTASCGLVPDSHVEPTEEQKAETALPIRAQARRLQFIRNLRPDPFMERELTSHIASRWYRAPEVILLEKVYCSPVDIWGVGCAFGELLQMIKANKLRPKDRAPLFPGTSCFPLSPQLRPGSEGEIEYFQEGEQLITICKVLGTPSEEEASFITDYGAKQYVSLLPKCPGVKFKTMFPDSTEDEIDLLTRMLTFNPYIRITAKEALRHPYFKSVRCKAKELEGVAVQLRTKAPENISIQHLKEYCDTQAINDTEKDI